MKIIRKTFVIRSERLCGFVEIFKAVRNFVLLGFDEAIAMKRFDAGRQAANPVRLNPI